MQLLVSYAIAPGPRCQAALTRLELPWLARQLRDHSVEPLPAAAATQLTPLHEQVHARYVGLASGTDGLVPWAALEARERGLATAGADAAWAWITPCHWRMSTHHVHMDDPQDLVLTDDEREALRQSMAPFFAEDGIALHPCVGGGRWLASAAVFADLPTASLDRVRSRAVDPWIPDLAQARTLVRLHNEMQMLLHAHPINAQRSTAGLPEVNALWISATGALPAGWGGQGRAAGCCYRDDLRHAALRDDADAWCAAWRQIDAEAAALAQQHRLETICLCGEEQGVELRPHGGGWLQRLRQRLSPPTPAQVLAGMLSAGSA